MALDFNPLDPARVTPFPNGEAAAVSHAAHAHATSVTLADLNNYTAEVITRRRGEPNPEHSTRTQFRWGTNGSLSCEIQGDQKGSWVNHETKTGGGALQFLTIEEHMPPALAREWLSTQFHIELDQQRPALRKRPNIIATYDYRDEHGNLLYQAVRLEPKAFRQRRPGGSGWIWKLGNMRRVPYRLPELIATPLDQTIYIPEGEKDVEAMVALGLTATCNSEGAGKWHPSFASLFHGRRVAILPDNDEAGRAHARAVFQNLAPVAMEVRVIELAAHTPSLPDKGDVSDWLALGGTREQLEAIVAETRPEVITIAVEPLRGLLPNGQDLQHGAVMLASAPGMSAPAPNPPRPQAPVPSIAVGGGQLSYNIDDAERELIAADQPIFQYGDRLVRIARGPIVAAVGHKSIEVLGDRTIEMTNMSMRDELSRYIDFKLYDARSRNYRSINCPADIAEGILHRVGKWNFPVLTGIIAAPIIKSSGKLLDKVGYDKDTGLYMAPGQSVFPSIKPFPTKQDAEAALEYLMYPLREVPFADNESRSVAISGILTALHRPMLDRAPIHAFDAPTAGSGKGLVCNYISIIALGHEAPAVTSNDDPKETDKILGAKLMTGSSIILIDNVDHPISSSLLAQIMTEPVVDVRILGQSRNISVPNSFFVMINGNNLQLLRDLPRRSLKCRIDAKTENPELRVFESEDPLTVARRDRGNLVAAALTILLAFRYAASPERTGSVPLGSFVQWSREIRNALLWLGQADPVMTQSAIRSIDRQRSSHEALVASWFALAPAPVTIKRLIQISEEEITRTPELHDALIEIAGSRSRPGMVDVVSLGKFFGSRVDQTIAGMRIERAEMVHHQNLWKVVRV